MAVEKVVEAVVEEIRSAGLVQLEVSARHVHLDKECVEVLFGKGYQLTHVRELSQPGQYLEQERVDVIGPKGTLKTLQFSVLKESTFRLRSRSAMLSPLESIPRSDSRETPKVPQA